MCYQNAIINIFFCVLPTEFFASCCFEIFDQRRVGTNDCYVSQQFEQWFGYDVSQHSISSLKRTLQWCPYTVLKVKILITSATAKG